MLANQERIIMMARKLLLVLLISMPAARLFADVYGLTFLPIPPLYKVERPELISIFRSFHDMREDGHGASLQATVFGGETTQANKIAKYFLPNEGYEIVVAEDDAPTSSFVQPVDINAYNLGIQTAPVDIDNLTPLSYASSVRFCPKQRSFGVGFSYYQRLPRNFWFDISLPVVRIENRLNMCETPLHAGNGNVPDGAFGSFIGAMGDCNTKRCYGRMTNSCLRKTGVPHVEARFGYDVHKSEECLHGWFVGITIPTGNKPCSRYLFEPILGNNGHVELLFGSSNELELLNDKKGRTVTCLCESVLRYLVPNKQKRSFDLKGKPWSRYMVCYKNDALLPDWTADDAVIGNSDYLDYLINYTTMCVEVHPHYNIDINIALRYNEGGFSAEGGANLLMRHAEDICLCGKCSKRVGIPAMAAWANGVNTPYTRSLAKPNSPVFDIDNFPLGNPDIQTQGAKVPTYIGITNDDIEENSAAYPGCMSQIIYGALSYAWKDIEYPTFISIGGSYESGHANTVTNRWLAWIKLGVSI